jgi:arylsulfatase A-like enzyme
VRAELDAYDGAIAYIDHQLGRVFRELDARGLTDSTIVIVTSDHGEQFGEHGLHVHGNSVYLPSLHVPLAVVYPPRIPAGVRVSQPAGLRDLPATVMSLTRGPAAFPGESLERLWTGENTPPEPVFSELTDIRGAPKLKSLVFDQYHYLWGEDGGEELYDLVDDPAELRSLVQRQHLDLVTELRRLMAPHVRNDRVLWERLPERAGSTGTGPLRTNPPRP